MEIKTPDVVLVTLEDTELPVLASDDRGNGHMTGPAFPSFLLLLGLAFTWFAIGFLAREAFFVFLLFNVH